LSTVRHRPSVAGKPAAGYSVVVDDCGLTTDDFSHALIGGVYDDVQKGQFAIVFRAKRGFDKAKMAEIMGGQHAQKNHTNCQKKFPDKTANGGDTAPYFLKWKLLLATTLCHIPRGFDNQLLFFLARSVAGNLCFDGHHAAAV